MVGPCSQGYLRHLVEVLDMVIRFIIELGTGKREEESEACWGKGWSFSSSKGSAQWQGGCLRWVGTMQILLNTVGLIFWARISPLDTVSCYRPSS